MYGNVHTLHNSHSRSRGHDADLFRPVWHAAAYLNASTPRLNFLPRLTCEEPLNQMYKLMLLLNVGQY